MATQGPNNGSSATSSTIFGTGSFPAWTSPTNVFASDNSYASILGHYQSFTQYLIISSFNFSIPAGSTINGFLVEVERRASSAGSISIGEIWLTKDLSNIAGTLKDDSANKWGTSDAYASYGGSSDLWGTSWNSSDVNASNFGVAINVKAISTSDVFIDHVRITIDYTAPAPGGMFFGFMSNAWKWLFGRKKKQFKTFRPQPVLAAI